MKEELRLLIELQTHDARIQEVEQSIRALPEKLQPARNDLARLEALLQGEKDELAKTEAWKRDQELTLQQEDDAIKKAKAKLQASSSTKEFTAANRELETKRKNMSEREAEILKVMDAIEASRKSIAEHEQDVEKLREHVRAEEGAIGGKVAELQKEIDASRAGRDELAAKIDAKMIQRYDYVRKRKGIALVPVEDGACAGCHMRLPPQLVNILARGETLEHCPSCQRLVFVADMLTGGDSPAE